MSIDPAEVCTIWYSQMYYNRRYGGKISTQWDTRVTAFKFDYCQITPGPNPRFP